MREQPWHLREPNNQHYQWFNNLVDFHALTSSWLHELNLDQHVADTHQLKRVLTPGVDENLSVLERLANTSLPRSLDTLLDDSHPDELLHRFETTVWVVQAWTLYNIIEQTPEGERQALFNLLEQCSWKQGRRCGSERWTEYPAESRFDLRAILAAIHDSPVAGYPHQPSFLIKRMLPADIEFELFYCPHHSQFLEVRKIADQLCSLHVYFMRGYLFHLNQQIKVDYRRCSEERERCSLRWSF